MALNANGVQNYANCLFAMNVHTVAFKFAACYETFRNSCSSTETIEVAPIKSNDQKGNSHKPLWQFVISLVLLFYEDKANLFPIC